MQRALAGDHHAKGGPLRAVRDLPTESWEFMTIASCYGLTLLRKKDAPPIRTHRRVGSAVSVLGDEGYYL